MSLKAYSLNVLQVSTGREWYIHTIYTVRSKENANRGIGKRSVDYQYHSVLNSGPSGGSAARKKRDVSEAPTIAQDIGMDNNRGTNIQHIILDSSNKKTAPEKEITVDGIIPRELNKNESEVNVVIIVVILAAILLLVVCLIAIVVFLLRRKQKSKKKEEGQETGSSEPMMAHRGYSTDSSEV